MNKPNSSTRQIKIEDDLIYSLEKVNVIGFKTSWIAEFKEEMKNVYENNNNSKSTSSMEKKNS